MSQHHRQYTGIDDATYGRLEDAVATHIAARPALRPDIQTRPGEGPPAEHIATIDWRNITPEDEEPTFTSLTNFLIWAVPRWGFTAEQFPYGCWWMHPEIVEEMTAWWTLWQAYIKNPYAHPGDPMAFNERTHNLRSRLGANYRGRCRKQHEEVAHPEVASPIASS
jgi:hypothetical protein